MLFNKWLNVVKKSDMQKEMLDVLGSSKRLNKNYILPAVGNWYEKDLTMKILTIS